MPGPTADEVIRPALPDRGGAELPGEFDGYSREHRPLASYANLVGLFHLAFVLFLVAASAAGRRLPERIGVPDILLLALATFKLSRLLSRDLVTSFLRAPFTTFEGIAGYGEVNEKPRGEGMQLALGELLTCPFCVDIWAAAFLAYGLVMSPPITRFAAGIMAAHALADFAQLAYGAAEEGAPARSE